MNDIIWMWVFHKVGYAMGWVAVISGMFSFGAVVYYATASVDKAPKEELLRRWGLIVRSVLITAGIAFVAAVTPSKDDFKMLLTYKLGKAGLEQLEELGAKEAVSKYLKDL